MTRNIKEFVNHTRTNPKGHFAGDMGEDHVCILLGLCNGAETLGQQLQSLADQSHQDWSLIVSDDASEDDWFNQVAAFSRDEAPGRIWVTKGPGKGYARNFLLLAGLAGALVPYAAFCDQDDVWLPHKLARALAHLKSVDDGVPAIYVSRTTICDSNLGNRRPSLLFKKPPSFANALVQSIGGGNTMVMNRAALDLLQDTAHRAGDPVSHDWWVYQLVSGAGGHVIYDTRPTVLYRQHSGNMIGANDTWRAQLSRLNRVFRGQFRSWNDRNLSALNQVRPWLTDEAKTTLDHFQAARQGGLLRRLLALKSSGVTRQRRRGTLALWIAALLNRL